MNTVSGSYQLCEPISSTLSGVELATAVLTAGVMWIGGGQFDLAADPAYATPYWAQASTENYHFSSSTATRVEEAKAANRLIDRLARLEDNWDGYDGSAISQSACDNARSFIGVIEAVPFILQFPDISPTAAGTISLAWDVPHAEVFFEIGDFEYSGYISPEGQPTIYLQGRANELDQQIAAFVQAAIYPTSMQTTSITAIQFSEPLFEHVAS
jgi:hypothetical protein